VKTVYVIFLLSFICFSCQEKQEKQRAVSKNEIAQPIVFNIENMWTDFEKRVSFPNWYNDSIIRSRQISAIHRSIYENPQSVRYDAYPDSVYLKEKISYYFYPNGHIQCISITSYVEGEKIGTVTFNYQNLKDKYGYNYAILSDTFSINSQLLNNHFQIDTLCFMHPDYLNFVEKVTGNHLFVVLNNKKIDALMIDSLFKPSFSDWIIQGNPRNPSKMYRLKNKVNQLQTSTYTYFKRNNQLMSSVKEHFPFETRRSLLINAKNCVGFIDSTFTNGSFLYKNSFTFGGVDLNTPEKITIKKSTHEILGTWETIEFYNYEKQPQIEP
jgi:hypothetical protein